jgi:molybdate transport system substrate-binding protein
MARGRRWRPMAGAIVLVGALLAAACGSATDSDESDVTADGVAAGGPAGDGRSGEILVFAAASLTDAFGAIADAFTDANPQVEVVLNLAGSQTLASQIVEGAPADVFAAANAAQMDVVAEAGALARAPEGFTTHQVAIAVQPGNPLGITGLQDLADPELLLVLPAEEVPAGRYARQALDAAGVAATPVSLERDVRAARSKVELGEADASIVYASDIVAADGRVDGVELPAEQNVPAAYPIARLAEAPNAEVADAFVAFVLSEPGQTILAEYGFTVP